MRSFLDAVLRICADELADITPLLGKVKSIVTRKRLANTNTKADRKRDVKSFFNYFSR